MTKHDLIAAIRQHNQSADERFLMGFDEGSLQRYLQRLSLLGNRGGPTSVQVREAESRSVVTRGRSRV